MKKRILGLALALIMIISLLPMTTFAAAPTQIKCVFYYPTRIDVEVFLNVNTPTKYIVLADNDATTDDTTDKKLVVADTVPTDNYIKLNIKDGLYTMTLKNFESTNVAGSGSSAFMTVNTSSDYDVDIVLEGTNKISGAYGIFAFSNKGNVTIKGSGSLEMISTVGWGDMFYKSGAGNLYIQNTTVKTTGPNGGGQQSAFTINGSVFVENSTIEHSESLSAWVRTATKRAEGLLAADAAEVQITNSNVVATTKYGANYPVIDCAGRVTITNSNVTLAAGHAANARISRTVPYIEGNYSSKKISEIGFGHKDYETTSLLHDFNLTSGDAIATGTTKYLKVVHSCVAINADTNCETPETCACGKEITPAKTHIAGANADDCTKDTMCGNAGCTEVFAAKLGTAHVAGQDDGDCTTDIKCSNPGCTQVATKGAEKHKDTRTDCAVAGTCANTGCTYAFTAGTHTGGTATCKAKAKCEICSKEYGELAACTPAADDGNCETAIKCSVCGKETTAAKTHKYTDKADTTCDNAGCTNTRKVEGTENPKTGDNTALVLVATLMVAAAAAFVTSKKFVR